MPDVIDEAYVNQVLAELNRIYGDAGRMVFAAGAITDASMALVESMSTTDEQIFLVGSLDTFANQPALLRDPPGDLVLTVEEILGYSANCLFAEVMLDNSAIAVDPIEPASEFITLTSAPGNATGWLQAGSAISVNDEQPANPCV